MAASTGCLVQAPRPCGDGCGTCSPAPVLAVTSVPGCATARLGNAVVPAGPLGLRLLGDVFLRVDVAAQPAGVLDAAVLFDRCAGLRVANGGAATWANAGSSFGADVTESGWVRLDACAPAPTTLQVAGPIIVGGPGFSGGSATQPLPIPGTLYFDVATRQFIGYDGTAFRPLQYFVD